MMHDNDKSYDEIRAQERILFYCKTDYVSHSKQVSGIYLVYKNDKEVGDRAGGGVSGNLGDACRREDVQKAIDDAELQLKIAKRKADREEEGLAYQTLGITCSLLGDFKKAIEYHGFHLKIAKEMGNRFHEAAANGNLGKAHCSIGDYKTAIHYEELHLNFAKEVGDRKTEQMVNGKLGNICHHIGDFKKAVDYHERYLKISQEIRDTAGQGKANGFLGKDYHRLGDFKKAIHHHELHLQVAKELGDRNEEGQAYTNLGKAFHHIGEFKEAKHFHELYLQITKELGDRAGEGIAYNSLGHAYQCIGDFQRAIKCQENCLKIFSEVGDRAGECSSNCGLGNAYGSLGNFKKAFHYFERCLEIATEIGDKNGEASAYGGLGNTYRDLGKFDKAKEYHELELKLAKQVGDQTREGQANSNLGIVYRRLRDFRKAIQHQERHLKIAKQLGDTAGVGSAYSYLGNSYYHLGDFEKAIQFHERSLDIAKTEGDRIGIGNAYFNLGMAYLCLGDSKRGKDYHERHLKIVQEVGDKVGEAKSYYGLGCSFELLGSLENSRDCYQSSVEILNEMRISHQFKDEWKISLRHMYQNVFIKLWLLLLKQEKIPEALFAAEQGRAQALKDLMELNYGLPTSSVEFRSLEEIIHDTSSCIPSVFTAVNRDEITFWVVLSGKDVNLRKSKINDDSSLNDIAASLESLLQAVRKAIGVRAGVACENRSLEKIRDKDETNATYDQNRWHLLHRQDSPLRKLYEVAVGPIIDLVDGDELIIVPEGPLWLAPYAAFINSNSNYLFESFRIRMIPSLTSLKLIADCPADYHCKTGALLVGDPWVHEVVLPEGGRLQQLPCAREEVEMIGRILNTAPLTGTDATKDGVLSRLSSVALVHIAAHGRMETGEIALTPNFTRSSEIPTEKDYLLTMNDVLNVKLRARLVVLSCCHSGRGEIKAEGVVGIARAFLGAGARSVLVSLWAIDDEATLAFMKIFYKHLMAGRSASESLNRAMKCMKESDKFSEVKYWAPFVLIGDDVTLDFGESD